MKELVAEPAIAVARDQVIDRVADRLAERPSYRPIRRQFHVLFARDVERDKAVEAATVSGLIP